MNKIDSKLEEIKQRKRIGLMTHVVVGYPSVAETVSIVKTMADSGIDFVELQIPFSDPLADGPTIMLACEKSLANGTTVKDAFLVMKKICAYTTIPLLFMTYYNTVFRYGVEKFCRDAKKAGAEGLIVPDMPIDEEKHEHFYALARKYDLHTIHVISPSVNSDRIKKNAVVANGFVYCTARQGITGAKKELDPLILNYLKKMKTIFSVPIAVGFGISQKEHIQALKGIADVAIIGSAIIDVIHSSDSTNRVQSVGKFIKDLSIE